MNVEVYLGETSLGGILNPAGNRSEGYWLEHKLLQSSIHNILSWILTT